MRLRILVVDDEEISRQMTTERLVAAGYEAEAHATVYTALAALERDFWDVVLSDVRMPGMDGLRLLQETKARNPDTAVILITAYGTVPHAVAAMQAGADDYLTKPVAFEDLRVRLERLAANLEVRREWAVLRKALGKSAAYAGLVGNSPAMQQVFTLIERYAGKPSNILITGETGTGKEQVARAIHMRSPRSAKPFVVAACASLPRELAESELFGHEAGSFTGAARRRKGRIELAQGGTLFLDDVDDVAPELQVKLLRVVQSQEFERVGGELTLKADVCFITATKTDLQALAKTARFREDLFYRLNVLTIQVPPLRERREDIPLLAAHFAEGLSRGQGLEPPVFSAAARERLLLHTWPGNVRELQHAVEHALANARNQTVRLEDLPENVRAADQTQPYTLNLDGRERLDLEPLARKFERDVIDWAMQKVGGNQAKAAELLGLKRTTLHYKLNQQEPQ